MNFRSFPTLPEPFANMKEIGGLFNWGMSLIRGAGELRKQEFWRIRRLTAAAVWRSCPSRVPFRYAPSLNNWTGLGRYDNSTRLCTKPSPNRTHERVSKVLPNVFIFFRNKQFGACVTYCPFRMFKSPLIPMRLILFRNGLK